MKRLPVNLHESRKCKSMYQWIMMVLRWDPPGTQQDILYLDGCTPSPLLTTNQPSVVTTLSSGAVSGRGRRGRDPSAAGSLLSPFGASSSADNSRGSSLSNTTRNAEQRDEARNNNAYETLQNLENHNNAKMTSWKLGRKGLLRKRRRGVRQRDATNE